MAARTITRTITDQFIPQLPQVTIDLPKPAGQPLAGGNGGSGGSGAAVSAAASADDRKARLFAAYDEMTELFSPGAIAYESESEEEIARSVAEWLRPGYDRAIQRRGEQTKTYGAELDADAVARGMGASTFVTDVKSRQRVKEAEDIAALESDYGAALSKAVSERLESERDRMLDVEMYNRDLALDVSSMAYGAAQGLVGVGGTAARGGGGGSSRRSSGSRSGSTTSSAINSPETCAAFLSILDDDERLAVYAGSDAQSQTYRDEIIASVGLTGFYKLQKQYGVAP